MPRYYGVRDPRDDNRKSNGCFLFWRGFAPYHVKTKLLLMTVSWRYKRDDVKTLQKGKISISSCRPWLKHICESDVGQEPGQEPICAGLFTRKDR